MKKSYHEPVVSLLFQSVEDIICTSELPDIKEDLAKDIFNL